MSISLSADEIFLLELILIPTVVSILSVLICEHFLFGKNRWKNLSDTAKSLSLFIPISFFLYLYFWIYLFQNPILGMQMTSTMVSLVGLLSSALLLRQFFSGKRFKFLPNFFLFFIGFGSVAWSSQYIATIIFAIKGVDVYEFMLSNTHLLDTGWTFLIWFGLLTPAFYIISIAFKDPSLLLGNLKGELSNSDRKSVRTIMSLAISIYSIIPILGNLAFAPIGLVLSVLNTVQAKNAKNLVSTVIGLIGTILLLWWLVA
jgi:hypothetical protein